MINSELLEKLKKITKEEQQIIDGASQIDKSLYMKNSEDIMESKALLSDGKQLAVKTHTRFIHFPKHSHDYVEIVYMCSGTTTHIINDETIELKEGELLFLCPGAKQEIKAAGLDDIAVNFIVMPGFFDIVLSMIGEEYTPLRKFLIDCLKNDGLSTGYLHFEVADILPIQNLLENLIYTLFYEISDKRNINQFTMGLLFLHLINHTSILITQKYDELIVKILTYIEENYKDGSLTQLSHMLHYDMSTLSKEIKNKTGANYTELLQEKRLSQSCFLLKNTHISIEDIAEKIGYENTSFFYRLFKKKYGISPREYRKKSN